MKKVFMIILCVTFFVGMAAAQTYTSGKGITGIDILGAHNDGGRGCAGCHAPHSGGRGGGGNMGAGYNGAINNDVNSGDEALFGQDLSPLYSYTIATGGGDYVEQLPAFTAGSEEIRGISMCLACHDGNVAKGGMMTNYAYEQRMNLLPAGLYGNTVHIPTLLGNDGSTAANYANDHPVGLAANFGRLRLGSYLTATYTNGAVTNFAVTGTASGAQYTEFIKNYGMPSIEGTAWSWGFANPDNNTNQNNLYVTCTTCHNQHVMYVYKGVNKTSTTTAIQKNGYYPTYFFVNAPYNPGAWSGYSTAQAPSTTQFCRQCHFGEANEAYGVNGITTVF